MSNKIEYSRLVFKRSSQPGVEPTIPTGTTIDSTWLDTDLLVGEGFINVEDDKFWFRTNNGVVQLAMSGVSSDNFYTEYAYTSGNTIVFDRNDTLAAYTVDLGPMLSGFTTGATLSGSYLPLTVTATTIVDFNNNVLYFTGNSASTFVAAAINSGTSRTSAISINDDYALLAAQNSLSSDNYYAGTSFETGAYLEYNTGNTVTIFKVNKSSIRVDSAIPSFNGITYQSDYSANYTNRSLVDKEYVDSVAGGTFTGGTVTGNVTFQGDVTMAELSATSISILNSGATARQYFDYSNNVVQTGVTNSAIISGSGNTIPSGVRNVFVAGVGLTASANDTAYFSNVNIAGTVIGTPCDLSFAISDETTAITTGTSKLTLYAPYAFTITNVYASLSESGSTLSTFNVKKNGTTIFSTPLTIDANEFHSKDAATPVVITGSTVAQFDMITVDIDSAGTGAKAAKIYIVGKRT